MEVQQSMYYKILKYMKHFCNHREGNWRFYLLTFFEECKKELMLYSYNSAIMFAFIGI